MRSICFDGIPGRNIAAARHLTQLLAKMLGRCVMTVQERCVFAQHDAASCGAIALLHAGFVLTGQIQELGPRVLALCAASRFADTGPAFEVEFGNLSANEFAQLSGILQEPGVPQDQCEARVQAGAKKLGSTVLKQALSAKSPWQAMKAAGSQPGSTFKWVKPEELTAQIEARAAAKYGAATKPKQKKATKSKSHKPATTLQVDAQHLQIAPGSFISGSRDPLSHGFPGT